MTTTNTQAGINAVIRYSEVRALRQLAMEDPLSFLKTAGNVVFFKALAKAFSANVYLGSLTRYALEHEDTAVEAAESGELASTTAICDLAEFLEEHSEDQVISDKLLQVADDLKMDAFDCYWPEDEDDNFFDSWPTDGWRHTGYSLRELCEEAARKELEPLSDFETPFARMLQMTSEALRSFEEWAEITASFLPTYREIVCEFVTETQPAIL